MGAAKSVLNRKCDYPDPVSGLSPKEVAVIKRCWAEVEKSGFKFSEAIFMEFFTRTPEYKDLFSLPDMPLEMMLPKGRFKAHLIVVINAFSYLFGNIEDTSMYVYLLQKNALGHLPRKVPPEAYDNLITAILVVLDRLLGSKFTPEVRDIWAKTLTFSFKIITEFSQPMPMEEFEQRTREILHQGSEIITQ